MATAALLRASAPALAFPQQQLEEIERGVIIYRRTDPLLTLGGLTRYADEREYRRMSETELAISNSTRALNALIFSFGWEIEPAVTNSGRVSAAARRLRDFAEMGLRQIVNLEDAVKVCGDRQIYHGWTPVQNLWRRGAFWQRGERWGIVRVEEKPQEHFAVLYEPGGGRATGEPTLVRLGHRSGSDGPIQVLDSESDRLAWIVLSAGSSEPYGRAVFRDLWLPYTILQEFSSLFARGFRNAVQGIPKILEKLAPVPSIIPGEQDGGRGAATLAQLAVEAREFLRIFEEYGVILARGGLDFELVTNEGFNAGCLAALNDLRRRITIHIEGQHLTSELGSEGGARALGDTQERTKLSYAQDVARTKERLPNLLIRRLIEVNIPGADPEDFPLFRFGIHNRVDREDLRFFLDYAVGGPKVDAVKLARRMHIPLAPEGAPDEAVLQKREAPAPVIAAAPQGSEKRQNRRPGESLPDAASPDDAGAAEPDGGGAGGATTN